MKTKTKILSIYAAVEQDRKDKHEKKILRMVAKLQKLYERRKYTEAMNLMEAIDSLCDRTKMALPAEAVGLSIAISPMLLARNRTARIKRESKKA